MSRRSLPEGRFLTSSGRLYRALLHLYPRAFRREFGPQMAQVFCECCRQAQGERGAVGILRLWVPTLGDLAVTALLERLAEGGHMFHLSRSVVIRTGGVAAMLGGALYLLGSHTHLSGHFLHAAVLGGVVCLIVGVVGLHARLWGREGRLGGLGFALVGVGLVCLIGTVGSTLGILGPSPVAPIINIGERTGPAFIGAGMLLWGVVTLRVSALGRWWSALPLVIGVIALAEGIRIVVPDIFMAVQHSMAPQVLTAWWNLIMAFALVEHSVVSQVFAPCWIFLGYALLTSRTAASPVPTQPVDV